MKRLALILTISFFSAIGLHSENTAEEAPHFINITTQSGLATNNVFDICTDKNGCLWMGTSIGLSRYDGLIVKNHFKEEMNIRSNFINYVFYDSRDRVWAGSSSGVSIYDVDKEKFFTLELLSGTTLENKTAWFFEDSSGTMWISFKKHGIISVDPDDFTTKRYFYDLERERYLSRIWFEPENNLYFAAHINDGLCFVDLQNQTTTPFSPAAAPESRPFAGKQVKGFIKIDDKSFFITCSDGEVYIVNPYERTYEQLDIDIPERKNLEFRRVFRVSDKHLALLMNRGFLLYDIKGKRIIENRHYSSYFDEKSIHCIAGNLDRGLIVGLHGAGVSIEQDAGFRFDTVTSDKLNRKVSLKGSVVTGFAESNDSTLWISTRLKGLFSYCRQTGRLSRTDIPAIPEELDGVVYRHPDLWLSSAYGIYRFRPETNEVFSYREGCGRNMCLRQTPDGEIYILTDEGLFKHNAGLDSFVKVQALSSMKVLGIGDGATGLIATTDEKGISRISGKDISHIHRNGGSEPTTHALPELIYEDREGRIWSSPSGAGICISCDNHHHLLNTRSGLASDIITNIIGDNSGNVFVSTDRSLSIIPPSGKMTTITKSDGLLNFGFTRDASYKTADGKVLLGSRDGFSIIYGAKESHVSTQSTIKIESIRSDGVLIPIRGNSADLTHRQNSVEICVSDIDPHHLLSRNSLYSLEGHDNTWIPVGEDGKITYSGLKPGRYTLHSFSPDIKPLHINIRPHPMLSGIAIIIYIIISIAFLICAALYIKRSIHNSRMLEEIMEDLDRERQENEKLKQKLAGCKDDTLPPLIRKMKN